MTPVNHEQYDIPGLGSVAIDQTSMPNWPVLIIKLSPDYTGDLRIWESKNQLPTDVYYIGDQISSLDDAHFARFLEVLAHWDHEHDGQWDCDHIIDRIDKVFYAWDVKAKAFNRPSGPLTSLLMKIMPPQPERHITYNFGELKPHFKRWHYLVAIPMLLVFLGLVQLQIWALPFMHYSPLSAWAWLAETIGFLQAWVILLTIIVVKNLLPGKKKVSMGRSLGRHTFGLLNKAAVYEEQAFREGSENWTKWQRLRSHFAFGVIHQGNLFYPLATILPLAVGGTLLNKVYLHYYGKTKFRRTAVLEASLAHRVYNRMALITVVLVMATLISSLLISSLLALLTFLGTHLAVGIVLNALPYRSRTTQEVQPLKATIRG
jgi:uncharacterized membrane protein (DUF485 family)